ncbi:hypothetical protein MW887_004776 [Aspergillus wentii]|nr:hypothetical protein MW887_004776 [Aspergillus wentii]
MRFLCLHGMGSNSRIFRQQTAALRYELGGGHSYDFVEGTVPWEADPAFQDDMFGKEDTFSYCDPSLPSFTDQVVSDLEHYLQVEGPYDGIMGFSLGANIAISWMLQKARENQTELPFKVGVFFSNTNIPYTPYPSSSRTIVDLDLGAISEALDLPTAHIWGSADPEEAQARLASLTCKAAKRSWYVHDKGHEVSTAGEDVIAMGKVINRAIAMSIDGGGED